LILFFLPWFFDHGDAVLEKYVLPGQDAPVYLDHILLCLDRVGQQGGLGGLRVSAEQQRDWASDDLSVEQCCLQRPGSQTDRRDVVPVRIKSNIKKICLLSCYLDSILV